MAICATCWLIDEEDGIIAGHGRVRAAHLLGLDEVPCIVHLHPHREASPTLQVGSLGPVVAMLQGVLKTGFGYAGAIDGIFGPVTEAVVRQYQSDSGLPVTGVMDERTWMAPAGAAGATLESLSGLIL